MPGPVRERKREHIVLATLVARAEEKVPFLRPEVRTPAPGTAATGFEKLQQHPDLVTSVTRRILGQQVTEELDAQEKASKQLVEQTARYVSRAFVKLDPRHAYETKMAELKRGLAGGALDDTDAKAAANLIRPLRNTPLTNIMRGLTPVSAAEDKDLKVSANEAFRALINEHKALSNNKAREPKDDLQLTKINNYLIACLQEVARNRRDADAKDYKYSKAQLEGAADWLQTQKSLIVPAEEKTFRLVPSGAVDLESLFQNPVFQQEAQLPNFAELGITSPDLKNGISDPDDSLLYEKVNELICNKIAGKIIAQEQTVLQLNVLRTQGDDIARAYIHTDAGPHESKFSRNVAQLQNIVRKLTFILDRHLNTRMDIGFPTVEPENVLSYLRLFPQLKKDLEIEAGTFRTGRSIQQLLNDRSDNARAEVYKAIRLQIMRSIQEYGRALQSIDTSAFPLFDDEKARALHEVYKIKNAVNAYLPAPSGPLSRTLAHAAVNEETTPIFNARLGAIDPTLREGGTTSTERVRASIDAHTADMANAFAVEMGREKVQRLLAKNLKDAALYENWHSNPDGTPNLDGMQSKLDIVQTWQRGVETLVRDSLTVEIEQHFRKQRGEAKGLAERALNTTPILNIKWICDTSTSESAARYPSDTKRVEAINRVLKQNSEQPQIKQIISLLPVAQAGKIVNLADLNQPAIKAILDRPVLDLKKHYEADSSSWSDEQKANAKNVLKTVGMSSAAVARASGPLESGHHFDNGTNKLMFTEKNNRIQDYLLTVEVGPTERLTDSALFAKCWQSVTRHIQVCEKLGGYIKPHIVGPKGTDWKGSLTWQHKAQVMLSEILKIRGLAHEYRGSADHINEEAAVRSWVGGKVSKAIQQEERAASNIREELKTEPAKELNVQEAMVASHNVFGK